MGDLVPLTPRRFSSPSTRGFVVPDELPAARDDLSDLIARRQIVHLWLEGVERLGFVPGVPTIAWELDNADVHLMAALPDIDPASAFAYRLLWRMIPGPAFIRRANRQAYLIGRPAMDITDPQIQACGQVIKTAYRLPGPNGQGGEVIVLELGDRREAWVEGVPSEEERPGQLLAGLTVTIKAPERTTFDLGAPRRGGDAA